MREKRYHKRYRVNVMDIKGEVPFARNVKVLNISLSGALLETDRSPDLGNRYMLRMESEGKELHVQGIVIRSTLHKNSRDVTGQPVSMYTAGLHFTNLSEEKILEIARFIKEHGIDTINQPAV
jgi:hypothetical protein